MTDPNKSGDCGICKGPIGGHARPVCYHPSWPDDLCIKCLVGLLSEESRLRVSETFDYYEPATLGASDEE